MKIIEQIGKFLPIGSVLIILLSSIKLVLFYRIFNISIVDFIGIQEIVTSFIDDILYYLAVFGFALILYLSSENFGNEDVENKKKIDYSTFEKQRFRIIIISIIILISASILFYSLEKNYDKVKLTGGTIYIIISLIYTYTTYTPRIILYPIFIFCGILIYTITSAYTDAYKIIENENPNNYLLIFKDKKIKTTENLKFLGNTEKYYFLYNIEKKQSSIISNSDIVEIGIRKKKEEAKSGTTLL